MTSGGKHIALIPAKARSSRLPDKNWKLFHGGKSLVAYLISIIPDGFFDKIILSTDKDAINIGGEVITHRRDKSLSTVESPINDLISVIIDEYKLPRDSYLWLLNPTSPIRSAEDFKEVRRTLEYESPSSLISATRVAPFIWEDDRPLFETGYPRKNTQDMAAQYHVENGQFIVFKVGEFTKNKTWYSDDTRLFRQEGLRNMVDIDTEDDFSTAKAMLAENESDETLKNETLLVNRIVREPVREHIGLLANHLGRYTMALRRLNISPEDVVIDSSCGYGYGSFILSTRAGKVFGLDVDAGYLESAKEVFSAENIVFCGYDEFEGEHEPSVADKVVCIETFEHISKNDIHPFVDRLMGYLKKGGDVFFTVPLGNNEPSRYNEFHLNEPSIDFIYDMFADKFRSVEFEIDTFVNSFGAMTKYCHAALKGKES